MTCLSHPTWVRGLKHFWALILAISLLSHPTWVRGLKLDHLTAAHVALRVAPYVGAWIETIYLNT